MLEVKIVKEELFDERTNEFIAGDVKVYHFEPSLKAIAEWESKWRIPFIRSKSDSPLTPEQSKDFVCMMNLDEYFDYKDLDITAMREIENYLADTPTATTIKAPKSRTNTGPVRPSTAEVIYAKMAAYNIPFDCDTWNINRLITLIAVCDDLQSPPKKMSKAEIYKQNMELNEQRKRQLKTKG